MKNFDLEKYFDNKEEKYYDPSFLITILEDITGKKFDTIKADVMNSEVFVTEEQIQKFLNKRLTVEDVELKIRIENKDKFMYVSDSAQKYIDEMNMKRYKFNSYILEYFKRYIEIVKNKLLVLLNIIEKIKEKNIEDILNDLDIVLDDNGFIKQEDIIRLIQPTIYNIKKLDEKVYEANRLETYLIFKISKESLNHHGLSEEEIYPTTNIQINNLNYGFIKGNIPLSKKQIKKLEDDQSKKITKYICP